MKGDYNMGNLNVKNVDINHEQANYQATEKARIVKMAKNYYLQKGSSNIKEDISKLYEAYKDIDEAGHNSCSITFNMFKNYFLEGIEQAKKESSKE